MKRFLFPLLFLASLLHAEEEAVPFYDLRLASQAALENPFVLYNQQGWAQTDSSIRGSSYTGAGISLNGLALKTPYSAHFNSELPLPAYLFSAQQTKTGADNISGALVGTLAYETTPQENHAQIGAGVGTREHYAAGMGATYNGLGGFLMGEKARKIDYDSNDLDQYAGGAFYQTVQNEWQIDLLASGQKKRFGADGYYGLPPSVSADQTTEDLLFFLGATRGDLDDRFFRVSSAFRTFNDQYQTLAPGFDHDVRSHWASVMVEGRTIEVQDISIYLRGDLESEWVSGTTGDQDRLRGSLLFLPQLQKGAFHIQAGVNVVSQTSESEAFLPQAKVDWEVVENSSLYLSYTENRQQPDYQTLENNPFLAEQAAQTVDLGFHQFFSESIDWRVGTFYRRLENASDWVGTSATDLGTLHVAGIESECAYYPSEDLSLRGFYQWIHKDNSRTDGRYELDYPEHLFAFSGSWNVAAGTTLFFIQRLRYQTQNDQRTGSRFGAPASLGIRYQPRFASYLRFSF